MLYRSVSEETFLILLCVLRSFSDLISNLLKKKGFKRVFCGKINNDPIELRFGINQCLVGNNLALDVSTFTHNERTLLLPLVSKLC